MLKKVVNTLLSIFECDRVLMLFGLCLKVIKVS